MLIKRGCVGHMKLITNVIAICLPHQCINNQMRLQNMNNSLHLPDKTLQFVKDHPLLEDPILPIHNRPRLITKDVNYTQIVVERVQALDKITYDVIFTGTGDQLRWNENEAVTSTSLWSLSGKYANLSQSTLNVCAVRKPRLATNLQINVLKSPVFLRLPLQNNWHFYYSHV